MLLNRIETLSAIFAESFLFCLKMCAVKSESKTWRDRSMQTPGKLFLIGFGPGHVEHMTARARSALKESDVVVGYKTYVQLIHDLLTEQVIVQTGMTEEVSRAHEAIKLAEQGKKVAVISSGDAGVYGMAGLIYEVLIEKGWHPKSGVEVEVIPGISAIHSCAALLGAPIMHDACTISLSDHLTPWETIVKRIEAAAEADFVIALYNPRSGRRTRQIVETQKILLRYRSPNTPVGLVKSAFRERQQVVVTTLERMLEYEVGMLTTVIIGNSSTFVYEGRMVTPRGYQRKYTLDQAKQNLRPHERLKIEAEPWALSAIEQDIEFPSKKIEKSSTDVQREDCKYPINTSIGRSIDLFEVAVSPGVANKKMTAQQLALLGEIIGDQGEIVYTPDHYFLLRIPTEKPAPIVQQLTEAGFLLGPLGDVVQVKACDFCDGRKAAAIPYAEQLQQKLGGQAVPKVVHIGFNGCGMACYQAVNEDLGIVYRKGGFDLFLGGKTVGRDAHPGRQVATGLTPEQLLSTVERIIEAYQKDGYSNERFYKFFERVGQIAGYRLGEELPIQVQPTCGVE
jgi:precorrin-3B C17-methyltransferase